MKFLIIFIFIFLKANVITPANVKVLRELNIEDDFIYNKQLQQIYRTYSKHKKEFFLNLVEKGSIYIPVIKREILIHKMPPSLVAVAMAESYLSLRAYSTKRASGLWQFMPTTARRFGLKIDDYVDERRDVFKSTKAAIEYLNTLHNFFGKWYLAIMAYNAGEARVVEAVVRAKVDQLCKDKSKYFCRHDKQIREYRQIIKNYQKRGSRAYLALDRLYKELQFIPITLGDLLRYQKGLRRQYLPRETRDYILKILAISFLFNSQDFKNYVKNCGSVTNFEKVKINCGTSLYCIAQTINLSLKKLKKLNPQFRNNFTPPYAYHIYLPYDKIADFKINFNPKKVKGFLVYRIKKGDTLIKIAKTYGVKVQLLRDFNNLGRYLHIGQKIFIPLNSFILKYRVKRGDSLRAIAKRFNTSYKKIMRLNNLHSTMIRVGQVLKIPQGVK